MHVILACIGLVVTDDPRQLLESFLSQILSGYWSVGYFWPQDQWFEASLKIPKCLMYTILKELAELKASLVVQWIAIFTSGRIYLTKWKSSNWPSGTTHVKIWRRNQFTQGSGLFEAWTCFTWIWVERPSQCREPALQGTPILRGKVPPEQYIFLEKFLPHWNCCWG